MRLLGVLFTAIAVVLWSTPLAEAEVVMRSAKDKIPAHPKRIVSINPCADALLLKLTDKRQIASVSHYSHDPQATSAPLRQTLRYPATSGTAEEILAMQPDLVVAGSHVAIPTAMTLERLNIPLVKLAIPQSVAESRQQISELSEIVGASDRGRQLNNAISAAFAKAKPVDDKLVPTLIWRSGGLVPGDGTLPDELLRHTGFENVSKSYGLRQWDILPLEYLVARPPQLLFSNSGQMESGGYRDRMLSHPVFKRLADRITIADYPARLLHCAGPTLIEAVTTLSEARRKLRKRS